MALQDKLEHSKFGAVGKISWDLGEMLEHSKFGVAVGNSRRNIGTFQFGVAVGNSRRNIGTFQIWCCGEKQLGILEKCWNIPNLVLWGKAVGDSREILEHSNRSYCTSAIIKFQYCRVEK